MCTAVTYQTREHYFGRTLDYECSYQEAVTITPRNYPFRFRKEGELKGHYALIGMAFVVEDCPLYYDATNEKGLSMAGLYFPGNAVYHAEIAGRQNIAQFEFIPWILGQCATVAEAKEKLAQINLLDSNFSDELPVAPLHWLIADREKAITVEAVREGLKIYDNPVGVLTNNPPFDMQLFHLNHYMGLSAEAPRNTFAPTLQLKPHSEGMGALGLPGDLSSPSRFVRASFVKLHSVSGDSESESISQFFHILGAVEQQRGCVRADSGEYEVTIYTSCCNTDRGIYYYTTYENNQITGVDMYKEDLNGEKLATYPLVKGQQVKMQN